MKKKILYISLLATISIGCFFVGKNTAQTESKNNNQSMENACDFAERIIDFNTDGNELSIMLSDGTEIYAYREYEIDEYKGNRIVDVIETDKGKIAIKKDGTQYNVNE